MRHESLSIALTQSLDKTTNKHRAATTLDMTIEREQIVSPTFLDLFIGIAEGVEAKLLVVTLDREVSALINDGHRALLDRVDRVEEVARHLLLGQIRQVEVVTLQQPTRKDGVPVSNQ